MPEVAALLFDLGGVVLHIDFDRALAAWQRHSAHPPERMRQLFQHDEPYRHHETGALPGDAYFAHVQRTLALECGVDAVREGWNRILVAEIEGTLALIDRVKDRVPCYALSNTNDAHLRHMRAAFPEVLARFRRVFVSHEIGHRKPHPEAFAHVLQAIGAPAGQVLFFDDLPDNVEAARRLGLRAALVRGPGDVADALRLHGLPGS